MSEIVNRVARALASRHEGVLWEAIPRGKPHWTAERGNFGGRFRDINEPFQSDYLDMAEAAIEAMREPTEQMIDAAVCAERGGTVGDLLRSEWAAMIDAALQE